MAINVVSCIGTLAFLLIGFSVTVQCKKDRKEMLCAACLVVLDEVQWEVKQVDPKKTLQVGSFRIDPEGEQRGSYQVPYAGSETHLTEVLEEVCTKMNSYALSTDAATGRKSYVRTSSRNGEPVTLSNISMSGETADRLKHDCETIVGDLEEDIIEVIKAKQENPQGIICSKIGGYCSSEREEL
eukprot:m.308397 g.308397  ORF g.308397 m.308397 type:complete len:184 (+) comp43926_c0_seq1:33-584(+)